MKHNIAWVEINWAGRGEKQEQGEGCSTVWVWEWGEDIYYLSLFSYKLIKWCCVLGSFMDSEWAGEKQLPQARLGKARKAVIDSLYACIKIFHSLGHA